MSLKSGLLRCGTVVPVTVEAYICLTDANNQRWAVLCFDVKAFDQVFRQLVTGSLASQSPAHTLREMLRLNQTTPLIDEVLIKISARLTLLHTAAEDEAA